MRITVIGTGYVGLVVGACLAETGNDVICADKDSGKIDTLKRNVLSIYEPGLDDLVARNQSQGRLTFTTDIPKFEDLGLPPVLKDIIMSKRGIMMFVGATGAGVPSPSTTKRANACRRTSSSARRAARVSSGCAPRARSSFVPSGISARTARRTSTDAGRIRSRHPDRRGSAVTALHPSPLRVSARESRCHWLTPPHKPKSARP